MPKLKRWIGATRTVPALTPEIRDNVIALGGNLAGGSYEVTQNISVNAKNREAIIQFLTENGYRVYDLEGNSSD